MKSNSKSLMVAMVLGLLPWPSFGADAHTEIVFVGSGKKNITAFRMDVASGALTPLGEAAEIKGPSYISIGPDGRFLYSVSEGQSKDSSFLSAFRIGPGAGKLTFLNRQPSGGSGPCHLDVDQSGKVALVANYGSGSLSALPIEAQGSLGAASAFIQNAGSGPNHERQQGPHAHCVTTSPDDRFAFLCDLGLDKVLIFKLDPARGTLVTNEPAFAAVKPGAGPRHIVFHPNGHFAYVINEMASSVTAFAYDADSGALRPIQDQSLLPADFQGNNTGAEIAVHPSGKFVYASNRGENTIVVFQCDPSTGLLSFVERTPTQGKTPRQFEIDLTGTLLLAANQDSGTVVVFHIDPATGRLTPTGNKVETDTPMCVKCLAE